MFTCKLLNIFFCLMLLPVSFAKAYIVAVEPKSILAAVPTDVIIAGYGGDQGDQFLRSAILAAQVSRDRFPQRQRVIISAINVSVENEKQLLKNSGFSVSKSNKDDLEKPHLLSQLKSINAPIVSLQFFGHNNNYNGFRLQSKFDRLDFQDKEFTEIGKYLSPNAFAIFYSCNSGWNLAKTAARLWKIPVFGSFTSSDFQEPMENKKWYFHNKESIPPGLDRIGKNQIVLKKEINCTSGKCLRLRPLNTPYNSEFGSYQRGLGFYKVFSDNEQLIPQALIHLTMLTPSVIPLSAKPTREELITVVKDWMCPSAGDDERQHHYCNRAVDNQDFLHDDRLNFFEGEPVACDNHQCKTIVTCNGFKATLGLPACVTKDMSNHSSTAFSDQMKLIFKGLDLYEQGMISF